MITRNNYEEFFLLYIDNELPDADKKGVEQFVKDNPDLEGELKALQLAILLPGEDLVFDNKTTLLKGELFTGKEEQLSLAELLLRGDLPVWSGESDFIDEDNYPTYLLSYIDNELDERSRAAVGQHVLTNPRLAEELAILRQTRLEPDHDIRFDRKDLLYKQEDNRRWLILSWYRMAAASILLIAGLLVFDKIANRLHRDNAPGNFSFSKKDTAAVTHGIIDPLYNKQAGDITRGVTARDKSDKPGNPADSGLPAGLNTKNTIAGTRPEALTRIDRTPGMTHARTAEKETDPSRKKESPGDQPADDQPAIAQHTAGQTPPQQTVIPEPAGNQPGPADVITAALQKDKGDKIVMSDEGIPFEEPEENHKPRLRGLFRKVSRVFEKTTHSDTENGPHEVLIGSFQVALK